MDKKTKNTKICKPTREKQMKKHKEVRESFRAVENKWRRRRGWRRQRSAINLAIAFVRSQAFIRTYAVERPILATSVIHLWFLVRAGEWEKGADGQHHCDCVCVCVLKRTYDRQQQRQRPAASSGGKVTEKKERNKLRTQCEHSCEQWRRTYPSHDSTGFRAREREREAERPRKLTAYSTRKLAKIYEDTEHTLSRNYRFVIICIVSERTYTIDENLRAAGASEEANSERDKTKIPETRKGNHWDWDINAMAYWQTMEVMVDGVAGGQDETTRPSSEVKPTHIHTLHNWATSLVAWVTAENKRTIQCESTHSVSHLLNKSLRMALLGVVK